MSIAQPLRVLNLYDVLVNLIPGATFLLSLGVLFVPAHELSAASSSGVLVAYIVLSYVFGHAIQWLASEINGTPRLFGDTMRRIREGDSSDANLKTDIRLSEIEDCFWDLCSREFDLSDDFSDYGKLLQLISSKLETTSANRALRFQSLHSFHRSMWAMCLAILLISFLSPIFNLAFQGQPFFFKSALVFFPALVGALVFQYRKEKFNRVFISYIITDFYIITKRSPDNCGFVGRFKSRD